MGWRRRAVVALALLQAAPALAQTPEVRLPVLVPLTGFVALAAGVVLLATYHA